MTNYVHQINFYYSPPLLPCVTAWQSKPALPVKILPPKQQPALLSSATTSSSCSFPLSYTEEKVQVCLILHPLPFFQCILESKPVRTSTTRNLTQVMLKLWVKLGQAYWMGFDFKKNKKHVWRRARFFFQAILALPPPYCLIFHFGCYFDFIEKNQNQSDPNCPEVLWKKYLIFTELWSYCPNSHLLLFCNFLLRNMVTGAECSVSDVHSARAEILLLIYGGWLCLGSSDLLQRVFTTLPSLWRQISPSASPHPSTWC